MFLCFHLFWKIAHRYDYLAFKYVFIVPITERVLIYLFCDKSVLNIVPSYFICAINLISFESIRLSHYQKYNKKLLRQTSEDDSDGNNGPSTITTSTDSPSTPSSTSHFHKKTTSISKPQNVTINQALKLLRYK